MLPEAPGLLSITICWFSRRPRCSATKRALVSVTPPGVKGTMMRMGLLGKLSSAAMAPDAHKLTPRAKAPAKRRRLKCEVKAMVSLQS